MIKSGLMYYFEKHLLHMYLFHIEFYMLDRITFQSLVFLQQILPNPLQMSHLLQHEKTLYSRFQYKDNNKGIIFE